MGCTCRDAGWSVHAEAPCSMIVRQAAPNWAATPLTVVSCCPNCSKAQARSVKHAPAARSLDAPGVRVLTGDVGVRTAIEPACACSHSSAAPKPTNPAPRLGRRSLGRASAPRAGYCSKPAVLSISNSTSSLVSAATSATNQSNQSN